MTASYWHVHAPELPTYSWSRDCRVFAHGCPRGAFAHLLVNARGACWAIRPWPSTCPVLDAACLGTPTRDLPPNAAPAARCVFPLATPMCHVLSRP